MRLGCWHSSWTWVLAGLGRRWSGEGLAFGSQGEVLHPLSSGSRGPKREEGGGEKSELYHAVTEDNQLQQSIEIN